jgi:hypothetical protein
VWAILRQILNGHARPMTAPAAVVDDNPDCDGKHNYKEQHVGEVKFHWYSTYTIANVSARQALASTVLPVSRMFNGHSESKNVSHGK